MPRDPRFRTYSVAPDDLIVIEVHAANGQRFTLRGRVDSVPWVAGEHAQKIVVVDATAEAEPEEERQDGQEQG